jgi:hypothetical protein
MMRLRLAGTVAALLVISPLAGLANDQDDALKIAQRAASMEGYSAVTVTLHAPPAGLPATVPLPKATLLGSLSPSALPRPRGGSSGRSATTVAYVNRPLELFYDAPNRDATVKSYEDALRGAGWKHVDMRQRIPFAQGGFALELPQFNAWCSPDAQKNALTIRTPAFDTTALDVSVSIDASHGMFCGADGNDPAALMMESFRKASPLPTFSGVNGVAIDHAGPANDGSTTGARITSSLGLAAVFETFAKQLRDAGWVSKTSASGTGIRTETFAKTIDGTAYVALLTIYPLDATHYVALADVSNVTP